MVNLRYNGNRFPRAVILNGHRKEVFHPIKRVIAFENSDAYLILKHNSRINQNLWEFDIVESIDAIDRPKVIAQAEPTEPIKPEKPIIPEKPTEPEKPAKAKKAMEPMRTLKPKQSKKRR